MSEQPSTIRHPPGTRPPQGPPAARERAGAVLLTLGAFAVVLASLGSDVFDLDRYLVPKALALHLTALALLCLGFPSVRSPRWGLVEWLLAGFVAWSALAAALAENRWLALSGWGVSFSAWVLFLAARELGPRFRWRTLSWLTAAAVLGSLLGIAQAYGWEWEWLAGSRPPGGSFGNRNFLAHFAAIALPAIVVETLRTRRGRSLIPLLLGVAVLAAIVVLTRSRAAWLGGVGGLAAAAVALVVTRRRPLPTLLRRSLLPAAAVAAAVAAAIAVPNRLDWTSDSPYAATLTRLADYREGSGRGRLIQYRNSLALVAENPLVGVGPGNWFVHYPTVTTDGDPAFAGHLSIPTNPWPSSDWVALLSERGVLAVLLLLIGGGLAAGRALALGRTGEREDGYAAAALVGVLVGGLVTGFFDAVLLLAAPSYLVWTTAGLLLPPPRQPLGSPGMGRKARIPLRVAGVLIALALVVLTGAHAAAIGITGDRPARATLERAARLAPGEHRLHLLLAEQGRCEHARAAAALMPHHEEVARLARRCGSS